MLHFMRLAQPESRMNSSAPFPRSSGIAIIGMGLIGGSLGMALRRRGRRVTGYDASSRVRGRARARGAASRMAPTLAAAVNGADVIVLCVPVDAVARTLAAVGRAAPPTAVVTDVASVKA